MFNLLHVHKYLQRGLKWLQGKNNMLPSVQNKKQKNKLFLQFVFSYCKVFTKQSRLTEFQTSTIALIRNASWRAMTYPHLPWTLGLLLLFPKMQSIKKPHHLGRCETIKLHHLFIESCSNKPATNIICFSMQDTLTRHIKICSKSQQRGISISFQQAFQAYILQDSHQNMVFSLPPSRNVVQMKREKREKEQCTPPSIVSLQYSGHAGPSALPTPAECWSTHKQTQGVWEMWIA